MLFVIYTLIDRVLIKSKCINILTQIPPSGLTGNKHWPMLVNGALGLHDANYAYSLALAACKFFFLEGRAVDSHPASTGSLSSV